MGRSRHLWASRAAMLLAGVVGAGAGCAGGATDGAGGSGGSLGEAQQAARSAPVCLTLMRPVGGSGVVWDAQIVASSPTKNYGTNASLNVGTNGGERQSLMKFDVSSIPSGPSTNITSAVLSLPEGILRPTGLSNTLEVHRATAAWAESTVTWQSFGGAYDPTAVATFSNGPLSAYPTTLQVGVAPLVQGWVQGTYPNDGLLLKDPGPYSTNLFGSEIASLQYQPSLAVCYDVTCAAGTADCNNDGRDGCETNIATSATSCGGCGVVCPSGACAAGACVPVCAAGAACSTGQPGVCAAGTTTCAGNTPVCQPNAQPTAEACNGLDDDCNGQVDDGNPGGGAACSTGLQGICGAGITSCTGGALLCAQSQQPTAEACNGLDDDCNGQVDDGNPGGGAACNTGLPGACAAGTTACTGGALSCAQTTQPTAEVCGNGIDDDCDGQVDEGCGTPSGCTTGAQCASGVCTNGVCAPACGAGGFCPTSATTVCGTQTFANVYVPAGVTLTCAPGCTQPVVWNVSGDVLIDGTINLDGANGVQGSATYQNPGGGVGGVGGVGACGGGSGGRGGNSNTGSGASGGGSGGGGGGIAKYFYNFNTAFYNGGNGSGAGYATAGIIGFENTYTGYSNPPGGVWGNAQLSTFLGGSGGGGGSGGEGGMQTGYGGWGGGAGGGALKIVASGFLVIGSGGVVRANGGTGGTQNTGAQGVGGGGSGGAIWLSGWTVQNAGVVQALGGVPGGMNGAPANAGQGGDGRIRVDYSTGTTPTGTFQPAIGHTGSLCGQPCSTGLQGACGAGTTVCNPNGTVTCTQAVFPAAEICDGIDNDCNGQVDDGNPGGGAACSTGLQGICGAGTTVCTGGALSCAQNQQAQAETCDGIDNDCDGVIDDGNPGGGGACSTGLPGACSAGTVTCTGGALSCHQNVQPSAETCNGIDDNCDGQIDEGNPGSGAACSTGLQGICGAGTTTCSGGALSCVQNQQAAASETCGNNLDDNCNGQVDEGCGAVTTCTVASDCPSGVCTGGVCAPGCGAGSFCPSASTTLTCGTQSYTAVYIPAGVTITCPTGCTQPVIWNVSGAAVIAGTIDLTGKNGAAGSANSGTTTAAGGAGGLGLCGGSAGGAGGSDSGGASSGSNGSGTGYGGYGISKFQSPSYYNGGNGSGAGYGTVGIIGYVGTYTGTSQPPGGVWGNAQLSTLLGGSGGGGGSGGVGGLGYRYGGYGGGAGGGAIKIVSGGYIAIGSGGLIKANGGTGGTQNTGAQGAGGGGSGGAIWLSSATVTNLGSVQALGGVPGGINGAPANAGQGGNGRIRVDTTGSVTPTGTFSPAVGYTGPYP